jgi:nitrous oxidase accessory protein
MRRLIVTVLLLAAAVAAGTAPARVLRAAPGAALQPLLNRLQAGDVLALPAGRYEGRVRIDRGITVRGDPGARIVAHGRGDAIRVSAAGVILEGLDVRNWGADLTDMNAGVFIERQATGTVVRGSHLQGPGFGIWVDGTEDVRLLGNRIQGRPELRSQDRGNGIHLYNVHGAVVAGNEVWQTRDGIYIDTSNYNTLRSNYLHDLRYGVHYMYSYHNAVVDNRTRHTRTGYALMQSKYLTVTGNRSEDDDNYGILMNFITHSEIRANRIVGVHRNRSYSGAAAAGAEGKALFMYNSLFNTIEGNLFAASDIGVHMTAGSEDNTLVGNAFIDNREQVKYVATRRQEWSQAGRGNYWSDYLGWDADGDGLGDTVYEPNDAVDRILWKHPAARLLLNAPAVEILRWVQRDFPVLRPEGVRDSHPLMQSPVVPAEGA